jgi:putative transposase
MVELTAEQRRAVQEQAGGPVEVIDPDTRPKKRGDWRRGILWSRRAKDRSERSVLAAWPIDRPRSVWAGWPNYRPRDWVSRVNRPFGREEEEAIRRSIQRGQPFGSPSWQTQVAARLGLESTFRPQGRPRKQPMP